MKYKVYALTVKWKDRDEKTFDFYNLKQVLSAAWELRGSNVVEYIKLRTEWRETPEWLKEIAKAGSALN